MALVVFTGPAKVDEQTILRGQLIAASRKAGIKVAGSWNRSCDYLVASRTDTRKAKGAVEAGKLVLTYDQYVRHLLDLGVDAFDPEFTVGAKPNKFTDGVVDDEPVEPGVIVL